MKPPFGFERDVLRHLNGEEMPGLIWGAAMSAAISALRGGGYVSGYTDIKITDAGREALANDK